MVLNGLQTALASAFRAFTFPASPLLVGEIECIKELRRNWASTQDPPAESAQGKLKKILSFGFWCFGGVRKKCSWMGGSLFFGFLRQVKVINLKSQL